MDMNKNQIMGITSPFNFMFENSSAVQKKHTSLLGKLWETQLLSITDTFCQILIELFFIYKLK